MDAFVTSTLPQKRQIEVDIGKSGRKMTKKYDNSYINATFEVAYRIAKCKKPHTIAEELVLAAALDLVSTMIGESVAQKLKTAPLSNKTVCREIDKISDDISDQLVAKMRG